MMLPLLDYVFFVPYSIYENLTLVTIKNSNPGNWIFLGDYNTVRRPDERANSYFCPVSASSFNTFIRDAELSDFSMGGEKFTYMATASGKLSKLDRFLACSNFTSAFPSSMAIALPRSLSDHGPIILKSQEEDYGPSPFKLYNSWLMKDGFTAAIEEACSNFSGYGNPNTYLAAKLKSIKEGIKRWKKKTDIEEKLEVTKIREEVQAIEKTA